MAEKQGGLTPHNTIQEMFEYFHVEEGGVRVAPMTIKEDADDTRLLMLVRGDMETASIIFAAMYDAVQQLSDVAAQQEAAQDEQPRIVTS